MSYTSYNPAIQSICNYPALDQNTVFLIPFFSMALSCLTSPSYLYMQPITNIESLLYLSPSMYY